MKVAEEYRWAITQAAGWLYCCRLVSSVLELRFQLYSPVCIHTVDHMYTQFILAQNLRLGSDLPERNYE